MTRDRRRGFTLIELLVVMGIILLLMGIAVISYQKLDKVAGDNSTRSRLQMCMSLENEFEAISPPIMIEGPGGGGLPTDGSPPNPIYAVNGGLSAPWYVSVGAKARYSTPYSLGTLTPPQGASQDRAVVWTSVIMQIYAQIPAIQSSISQLPPAALLPSNPDATAYKDVLSGNMLPSTAGPNPTTPNGGNNTMVIVDGWKNPIIYVPSGGLAGVWMDGMPFPSGWTTAPSTGGPWGHRVTVRSVDGRPFWASAGQDGNFQYGDDNLYSCPVMYINTP